MKLQDLHPNFNNLSDTEQQHSFELYHTKRAEELSKRKLIVRGKKKGIGRGTTKPRAKKIPVNPEQLAALRKLGLI